ncbi:mitochondrial carrier homolog 1-like isoform X2 [Boleophthalmus pectinirostris]|uniref:mitochondrial carrier homolog 1-like isoform X2 n=1 Tax=Boleophthalmus pectinirostris TaxID=150288 RepID=UPI0024315D01|nr:mitochondrial carrier homolog 1-like isoform X2 [Boleophthalmus pectinirostris]
MSLFVRRGEPLCLGAGSCTCPASSPMHILEVDGSGGLFRGLSPHIVCCAVSTLVKRRVKQMELVSAKDEQETSLKALVKETSHEMLLRCVSRVACHPFHVVSVRCMAQFVGREEKYRGMLSCVMQIFNEEGLAGFYVGLVPHVLGELLYLWGYNLLCHFINTYADDDTFSQASAIRSYTKFVMNIAVNVLRYPFTLVGDLMALNDCGLAAGLPPYSPVFKSWLHCWTHLRRQGNLFRGSSLFFRRVPASVMPTVEL